MPNTLTGLIPDIYEAFDTVSREIVGVIPGVTLDSSAARAAVGQTVTSPVTPAATATDITPGVTPPDDGDQVIGNVQMTISKSRRVPIRWNGEQTRGVNSGVGTRRIFQDQVAQGIRTLVNEMEADVVLEARRNASRAYGIAGTAPFGTPNDLTDSSGPLQILEDNGAAGLTRSLILAPSAMNNVRGKQSVLFKVNEAGTDQLLRQGILGDLHGAQARQSAQLRAVVKGTGAGYLVNNGAGYAVGAKAIALDTGAGTVLAGDVVTFTGDGNKYVVATALTAGVVTLAEPGLLQAVADNTAMTVGNSFTPSILHTKASIVLATRAPALPMDPSGVERDMAEDRMSITDPVTGLSFELAVYTQYRQIQYEIAIAWGQKAQKREHIALLLG